ncbi:pyroglutamyl-peptidase I [Priestia koreensis]|uniref:pyroglutamyl-peptidase I n=1 Tax=Priestia koreensis TaxID=284581 RepID=UPI002040DBD9|nr:pyroglutamyl-peptidase I [Priestia koreensis]MCM3006014.1 pyroglutamyl-peptidase I [Priestia koreensis]
MKTILLTGFEPFDGEKINPSLEAVKQLHQTQIVDHTVISKPLPTVFNQSISLLQTYIDELEPSVVICVGQAGGRDRISIERVAINVDDARIPDNEGQQPIDQPIVDGGPVGYWSSLPIKAIVRDLTTKGIPGHVSHTAGTYVCNHLFYGLMHHIKDKDVKGGFIHIPFIPEQAVRYPGKPSMSLEMIVAGLQSSVETALTVEEDIKAVGGDTH